ncbi:unnamed protein product [Linum tenue]|uniref:Carboxypeptidase n=1 Tax=Linum tenue TaxID=586396 RepID=A0AAV0JNK5_9ROSI|nr:unnamed protein product [Linum tenue]
MLLIAATILVVICRTIESTPEEDKIVKLPGQPEVSFQQYAGYVTVDETQQRKLFYYFVEAETNSTSKPLVLWLNGGPGCSSVGGGAFTEHGPFKPNAAGYLVKNDYSWNKEANMIYLESPAGVGFSYSTDSSFYNSVNDTITAHDNLAFLQQWLLKFPQYKNRDLFIAGESYAGHYVPQLAQLIVESESNLSMRAIAIGNPTLEFDTDFNAEGQFYWSHGLISEDTYNFANAACNTSRLRRQAMSRDFSESCKIVAALIHAQVPEQDFDTYDVTADSCLSKAATNVAALKQHSWATIFHPFSSLRSNQAGARRYARAEESTDLCIQDEMNKYLNRKDVQQAMHAQLVAISNWTACTHRIKYDESNLENPTIGVVGSLVGSGIRVLVYSGDQDAAIPFIGTRSLVNRLSKQLGLNTTVPYKPWFDDEQQVGGWTQVYGENNKLSYATIRGASHMAPLSSPKRSLTLFAAFLAGKPLAA